MEIGSSQVLSEGEVMRGGQDSVLVKRGESESQGEAVWGPWGPREAGPASPRGRDEQTLPQGRPGRATWRPEGSCSQGSRLGHRDSGGWAIFSLLSCIFPHFT